MNDLKKIFFTVTNDLTYDQRMKRICSSLSANGFSVVLVGRKLPHSLPLSKEPYHQVRLNCFFSKGKLFYLEFNIRLFSFLLSQKKDCICAIDLDTILPCYFISRLKKKIRVYDAHELFTELKEVVTRPFIKKIWLGIEKYTVPKFLNGYTVCESIAEEFHKRYAVKYQTIRNLPFQNSDSANIEKEDFILYQGAVNEGRGFEFLIPAMKQVDATLIICGDGNFMSQLVELIAKYELSSKIILTGMLTPEELKLYSQKALIGISILENTGLNQYLSLQNKFFDYINVCLPQVSMNFPEYKRINDRFEVAVLLDDLNPVTIAKSINDLKNDRMKYEQLQKNCLSAKAELNWGKEEIKLIAFYKNLFQKN
jgi:glycosyltransferase involved in cell wall biosynthesis